MRERHAREVVLDADDVLVRLERQPIRDPVGAVHVVDAEPVERSDQRSEVARRSRVRRLRGLGAAIEVMQRRGRDRSRCEHDDEAGKRAERELREQQREHRRQHDQVAGIARLDRPGRDRVEERKHDRDDVEHCRIRPPHLDEAVDEEDDEDAVDEVRQRAGEHRHLRERVAEPGDDRQERRDEDAQAVPVRRLHAEREHVERAEAVPHVPEQPGKHSEDGERCRDPDVPQGARLLPQRPRDQGQRNRDDLRRLPVRETEYEPEDADARAVRPLRDAQRQEHQQSAVDDVARIEPGA